MAADDKEKTLLLQELRQVIQADRMAMDLINGAVDTRQKIEKRTEEERRTILREARQKRDENQARIAEENRARLARRKEAASQAMAGQRQALQSAVDENGAAWAEEIARRILDS